MSKTSEQPTYQWRRTWKLYDLPDARSAKDAPIDASAAQFYGDIDHFDCLCLIGPPGSGKTTEGRLKLTLRIAALQLNSNPPWN